MKMITSAIFENYSPRKDKTISMRFSTNEKTPAEIMEIHKLLDTFGYLYFKAEETLSKEEIKELDGLETDLYDNPKTQSQRLRNTLHVLWHQQNEGFQEFKDFYKHKTEQIIEHFKSKLR